MKPNKTRLFISFNNKKHRKMAQQIDSGQTLTGKLVLWDIVKDEAVPDVFFSDPRSAKSSDESIVAVKQRENADFGFIDFTGGEQGDATVDITVTANYTNSNGAPVSPLKKVSPTLTVPAAANETELRVYF